MARNKDWQKENFEKYRTSVVFQLRRVADEVEQLKIDPDSLGLKNELGLAQQIISLTGQLQGQLAYPISMMVQYAGLIQESSHETSRG